LCDDKTKEPPLTQTDLLSFLLVSGRPIEEPVAWYEPIVMNTQEQLRQAMAELQTGKFIRHR
jgi:redox-sensitive bicupin YhaK (pirin superfamily)